MIYVLGGCIASPTGNLFSYICLLPRVTQNISWAFGNYKDLLVHSSLCCTVWANYRDAKVSVWLRPFIFQSFTCCTYESLSKSWLWYINIVFSLKEEERFKYVLSAANLVNWKVLQNPWNFLLSVKPLLMQKCTVHEWY